MANNEPTCQPAPLEAAIEAFCSRPQVHQPLETLRHCLSPFSAVFIFGGALRDRLIETILGLPQETADVDLIIAGQVRDLRCALGDERTVPHELGGIRWFPEGSPYSFDLVRLEDFVVIRRFHGQATPAALLAAIDFSVNAVMYDPSRTRLIEKGCIKDIRRRLIRFNTPLMVDKALLAYRALALQHKTGFYFSEGVFRFLQDACDLDTLGRIKSLLSTKMGKSRTKRIMEYHRHLCGLKDYSVYRDSCLTGQ